jgi:hypothetical protein
MILIVMTMMKILVEIFFQVFHNEFIEKNAYAKKFLSPTKFHVYEKTN